MTAPAWAGVVSGSTTGVVDGGLSATWSCEDRPCGVCQRKMTTWPVGKLAPAAGAWSDGGGWSVMFTFDALVPPGGRDGHRRGGGHLLGGDVEGRQNGARPP